MLEHGGNMMEEHWKSMVLQSGFNQQKTAEHYGKRGFHQQQLWTHWT